MTGTLALAAGRLELESIVRAPLVVIADPMVAASGPPATLDEIAGAGGGPVLLERPAGTILAMANPSSESGLFVWAGAGFLAVIADPNRDIPLEGAADLTVASGRLVAGAPEVVAAWGADVDTGDGSPARARMHRGGQRLGLIVVCRTSPGVAAVAVGPGAASVTYPGPTAATAAVPLALAG